ncbi:hypothetical protein PAECIP112173_05042 [Paenibacillus sp. JJ-100]|nr:hypothetical protein PAECIP112173_05042 [Paenibacillus sp. JJ-100]
MHEGAQQQTQHSHEYAVQLRLQQSHSRFATFHAVRSVRGKPLPADSGQSNLPAAVHPAYCSSDWLLPADSKYTTAFEQKKVDNKLYCLPAESTRMTALQFVISPVPYPRVSSSGTRHGVAAQRPAPDAPCSPVLLPVGNDHPGRRSCHECRCAPFRARFAKFQPDGLPAEYEVKQVLRPAAGYPPVPEGTDGRLYRSSSAGASPTGSGMPGSYRTAVPGKVYSSTRLSKVRNPLHNRRKAASHPCHAPARVLSFSEFPLLSEAEPRSRPALCGSREFSLDRPSVPRIRSCRPAAILPNHLFGTCALLA